MLGATFSIERIAGGQSNPTYFVTLGERRMVLRKKPAGETLPSAHAVDREHRVLSALSATDVPRRRPFSIVTISPWSARPST